jgi:hypothetical protein
MGYRSGNSIKKWHLRSWLDDKSFSGEYTNFTVFSPREQDEKICKLLHKMKLGVLRKYAVRDYSTSQLRSVTEFKGNEEAIQEWYLKFDSLPKVIRLDN